MFKVGDKVWCAIMGWGKVTRIEKAIRIEEEVDSIVVNFSPGVFLKYTADGKRYVNGLRILFFEEIPIPPSALERPRFRAKEGEVYQFISEFGSIIPTIERESADDDALFKVGNYFETREEAEESEIYKAFEKLKHKAKKG